jgi:hypothetical protein
MGDEMHGFSSVVYGGRLPVYHQFTSVRVSAGVITAEREIQTHEYVSAERKGHS